jgi:DNA-binding XRE family transcriptional regulator
VLFRTQLAYLSTLVPATSVALPSLVYWRVQRGFTQEQLAKHLGMHRKTLCRGSKPAARRSCALLACLVRALHVRVADLSAPEGIFTYKQLRPAV